MTPVDNHLLATVSEKDLLALIDQLNADPKVSGILVQLPLPKHIDAQKIIHAIAAEKDVDGFHPLNVGRHASGSPGAGAVYAARLCRCWPRPVRRLARRARGGGDRSLQHRRQAGGAIAAGPRTPL